MPTVRTMQRLRPPKADSQHFVRRFANLDDAFDGAL
jgi:hypothetical protein